MRVQARFAILTVVIRRLVVRELQIVRDDPFEREKSNSLAVGRNHGKNLIPPGDGTC